VLFGERRYAYFLIWGNGRKYREEIVEVIKNKIDIEMLCMIDYKPKSISRLIRAVYSYDYAPLHHLRSKTRYLNKSTPNGFFIFIQNNNPQEEWFGSGEFLHLECSYIKSIKEDIRNRFNPRANGKRTEEHVIHASDNELQVDRMLRYLGYSDGLKYLSNVPNPILSVPYYIPRFSSFAIRKIESSELRCKILRGESGFDLLPIIDTPHFACLSGHQGVYEEYLSSYKGTQLISDYSVEKFIMLSKDFMYLSPPYDNAYILVKRLQDDQFQILDGVHRASILKCNGVEKIIVAEVNDERI